MEQAVSDVAPSGQYRILSVLGQGAFGTVYRARFEGTGGFLREVAIKVLHPDLAAAEEIAARLRDEARLLGLLHHPAIVGVDRLLQLEGRWAVVMELVEGVDLRRALEGGPLPPAVALEIGAQVAGALHAAWHTAGPAGAPLCVLHRDIKPANVLVTAWGEVKVLDFGVARAELEGREARTGRYVLGSPDYIAPERLDGEEGPAGDVYSLGVLVVELLTGVTLGRTTPAVGEHAARVADARERLLRQLGPERALVPDLLEVLLAGDPAARPTAAECQEALAVLAEHAGAPGLRRWAMERVPPLLGRQRVQAQAEAREAGIEGTVLVVGRGGLAEGDAAPAGSAPPPTAAPPGDAEDSALAEPTGLVRPPPSLLDPAGLAADGPFEDDAGDDAGDDTGDDAGDAPAAGPALDAPAPGDPAAPEAAPLVASAATRSAVLAAARRTPLERADPAPPPPPPPPWRLIAAAIGLGAGLGVVGMLWLGHGPPPPDATGGAAPGSAAPGSAALDALDRAAPAAPSQASGAEAGSTAGSSAGSSSGSSSGSSAGSSAGSAAPADPPAETAAAATGVVPTLVQVVGDASRVYLESPTRRYAAPGPVPPGGYRVVAVFPGQGSQDAGTVQVGASPVELVCSASTRRCEPR